MLAKGGVEDSFAGFMCCTDSGNCVAFVAVRVVSSVQVTTAFVASPIVVTKPEIETSCSVAVESRITSAANPESVAFVEAVVSSSISNFWQFSPSIFVDATANVISPVVLSEAVPGLADNLVSSSVEDDLSVVSGIMNVALGVFSPLVTIVFNAMAKVNKVIFLC